MIPWSYLIQGRADALIERVAKPTDGQARAGNYRKGHIRIGGLDITIETPRGRQREGKDWKVDMPAHYGYVRRTLGNDGDQVDVFLGPLAEQVDPHVFVIDQHNPETNLFDEHKCVIGVPDEFSARELYCRAFSDGRGKDRIGGVTRLTWPEFRAWLRQGDMTRPLSKRMLSDKEIEQRRNAALARWRKGTKFSAAALTQRAPRSFQAMTHMLEVGPGEFLDGETHVLGRQGPAARRGERGVRLYLDPAFALRQNRPAAVATRAHELAHVVDEMSGRKGRMIRHSGQVRGHLKRIVSQHAVSGAYDMSPDTQAQETFAELAASVASKNRRIKRRIENAKKIIGRGAFDAVRLALLRRGLIHKVAGVDSSARDTQAQRLAKSHRDISPDRLGSAFRYPAVSADKTKTLDIAEMLFKRVLTQAEIEQRREAAKARWANHPRSGDSAPSFRQTPLRESSTGPVRRSPTKGEAWQRIGTRIAAIPPSYTGSKEREKPVDGYEMRAWKPFMLPSGNDQGRARLISDLKVTVDRNRADMTLKGKERGYIPEKTEPRLIREATNHAIALAMHDFGVGDYDFKMSPALKEGMKPLEGYIRYARRRMKDQLMAEHKGAWRPYRLAFGKPFPDNRKDPRTGETRLRMRPNQVLLKFVPLLDAIAGEGPPDAVAVRQTKTGHKVRRPKRGWSLGPAARGGKRYGNNTSTRVRGEQKVNAGLGSLF